MKQTILITGIAGFVGACLAQAFAQEYDVHGIVRSETNLWRLEQNRKFITLHLADLTHKESILHVCDKIKPAIIIHTAAYGTYLDKQHDLHKMLAVNMQGTINLLQAAAKSKISCFINTGTSSEYGFKGKPMKETDVLDPNNPYAVSKAAATLYCKMFARQQKFSLLTLRLFSVYGYYEDEERLITYTTRQCLTQQPLFLAKKTSVRDFIFIDDVVLAYRKAIMLSQTKQSPLISNGEIINIGSGQQHTVEDIVKIIVRETKTTIVPVWNTKSSTQREPEHWQADISKAKQLLNWQPQHTVEQGLIKTINMYQEKLHQKTSRNIRMAL